MISYTEIQLVPEIGQLVHFYQGNNCRLAAFVVNTHPLVRTDDTAEIIRPTVDLQVCKTDGKIEFIKNVEPVIIDNPEDLDGKWSFKNEISLNINIDNDEECEGVNANFHVGLGN